MSKLTVISTFAGCGGSSLGYRLAGFQELLAVEWDDNAVQTFKLNFPDVPVYHGDIAKLSGLKCMELAGIAKGELDVFDGSPPCQGFSTAGKRKYDDYRNSLFAEYARLIEELQPKVFVMENVTGMVKGYMKQAYLEIMRVLRGCGYKAKGVIMNAKYFNVPQSRERVIVIGVREDLGIEPSHPRPQSRPVVARQAIQGLPLNDIYLFPTKLAKKWWEKCSKGKSFSTIHPKSHWFNQQKASPDKPFPTITKSVFVCGGAGVTHWDVPGQLSIAMVKRAASFPDDFILEGKYQDKWARIGNSVPPKLMRAIAEHIKANILELNNAK